MAERKMPQNLEAEMSILGSCFLSSYGGEEKRIFSCYG